MSITSLDIWSVDKTKTLTKLNKNLTNRDDFYWIYKENQRNRETREKHSANESDAPTEGSPRNTGHMTINIFLGWGSSFRL